jgi:hypothetical protein
MSDRNIRVLWCGNTSSSNGWQFPPAVAREIRAITQGQRVCHLFGGRARFGLRCDIDPIVRPDVLSDAWLPPFRKDAFDVVVLDPPYHHFNVQMKQQLLQSAAYIARESVIWFHTLWISPSRGLIPRRSWLVRVGDTCAVRCLQEFTVRPGEKQPAPRYFTRGPAMKYNRWLAGQQGLPYE